MDMVLEIIDQQISKFTESITMMANMNLEHHFAIKPGGFPMLVNNNNAFYEQMFFNERIENAIWRYLINGVLKGLLSEEYCKKNSIACEWTYMNPQRTTSYLETIERLYPIEFKITKKGKTAGYRYSEIFYFEERLDQIFENYHLDELNVIDFSSSNRSALLGKYMMVPPKYRTIIKLIPFRSFFLDFFPENIYIDYMAKVQEAISNAFNYVGLQTITNLTPQHLSYFSEAELDALAHLELSRISYTIFHRDRVKGDIAHILDSNPPISERDYSIMNASFYDSSRYRSLVGSKDFAHSFITAEYLYNTLKSNNNFEYTSIVCGYLKSVEQLMYLMTEYTLMHLDSKELWIKCNSKKHGKKLDEQFEGNKVRFVPDNEKYFDTTFGSLANFLHDNASSWNISSGARERIYAYLRIYCDECRNEHFHKDNINDIHEVEIIRNNTLVLHYYLLGGYILSGDEQADEIHLGVTNRSFDRMYRALMKQGTGQYYLLKFSGSDPIFVALPMSQQNPQYDRDGILYDTKIRFIRINRDISEDWHADDWVKIEDDYGSENVVYVTPEHRPESIIYFDKMSGQQIRLSW